MRLLRLVEPGEWMLELHPYVTVVRGLSDARRRQVVSAFVEACRGRVAELAGLIEAHGVVLDLDETSLGLLEVDDVEVDVVVEASDLPGAGTSDVARQLRAAERRLDRLTEPRHQAQSALEAAEEQVHVARAAVEEARSARAQAGDALDAVPDDAPSQEDLDEAVALVESLAGPAAAAAGAVDSARRDLARAEAAMEEAEAIRAAREREIESLRARRAELVQRLDPDAPTILADAEAALAEALEQQRQLQASASDVSERARSGDEVPGDDDGALGSDDAAATGEGEPEPGTPEGEGDRDERVAELESRVAALRTALSLQDSFDPQPVRNALDTARAGGGPGGMVPSVEAIGLADQLANLDRELERLRDDDTPPASELEAAAERVENAQAEYARVEADLHSTVLSDEERAQLEQAHDELIAAQDAADSRFGRARAQRRLAQAQARQDELLERHGFRTWTDFLTAGSTVSTDPAAAEALQAARLEVLAAEAEHRDLRARVDAAISRATVLEDRARTRRRGLQLLADAVDAPDGTDPDELDDEQLIAALLTLQVPGDRSSSIRSLTDALGTVGLPVEGLDLDETELLQMAADWLDEHHRSERHRMAMQDEIEEIEAELAVLAARDEGDAVSEPPPPVDHLDLFALVDADDTPDAPSEIDLRVAELEEEVAFARRRVTGDAETRAQIDDLDEEIRSRSSSRDVHEDRGVAEVTSVEHLRGVVAEAEAEHERLESARQAAEDEVVRLRAMVQVTGSRPDLAVLDRAVDDAEAALAAAEAEHAAAAGAVDEARGRHDAAVEEVAALRHAVADLEGEQAPVEELEWYLLARLAAQRDVCFAGSVPLVLDHALDALEDDAVSHLLDRLERMAGAVQVVHVTDDPRIAEWAEDAGLQRAAVVAPLEREEAESLT